MSSSKFIVVLATNAIILLAVADHEWTRVATRGKDWWFYEDDRMIMQSGCLRVRTNYRLLKENVATIEKVGMDGEQFLEIQLRSWDYRDSGLHAVLVDKAWWDAEGSRQHWAVLPGPRPYVTSGPLPWAIKMHNETRKFHGWTPRPGITTDHVLRNPLDNRLSQLRDATPQQQAHNRGKPRHLNGKSPASEYLGVTRKRGRWEGRVRPKDKPPIRELFDTQREAALFVNKHRRLEYGAHASLNVIN
jgi:hypothetical protein